MAAAAASRRLLSTAKFGFSGSVSSISLFSNFGCCRQISQLVKPTSSSSSTSNGGFPSAFDVASSKLGFLGSMINSQYYNKFDCRQIAQLVNKQPTGQLAFLAYTVELARILEAQGVPSKQVDAASTAIIQVLKDSLKTAAVKTISDVSKLEIPKIEMIEEADFSKSKSELIKMLQEAHQSKHNSEVQRYLLEREIEHMQSRGASLEVTITRPIGTKKSLNG